MPPLPSPSTWRTHPQSQDVRLFILTPDVVLRRAINQTEFTYPVATLTFDNPGGNPGSYTDTEIGQTIAVYDSTGDTLKGLVRLRSTTNPTVFYISPTSQGDIDFENNDVLEVWDEYRLWAKIPRLDESGTQYKDWDVAFLGATASQPPVANTGSWVAQACPVGGAVTIPFDGTQSYAVAEGATIVGYLWNMKDGSYITGSSTSSTPTVSFPAGYRWISLRVEDSNGWTHTAHALVVTDDGTLGTRVSVSRLGGTVENGWEGSFALLENDLSGFPDGACVILWAVETYGVTQGSLNGPAGRQQVKFCGWLVEELDTIEPLLSDVVVNGLSALGFLGHLPAFSMTTEYAAVPVDWTQIANMSFWRQAQYLMQWHSTLLDVCDVLRPDYYALYPYPRLNATEGMLDEQLQFVANAVGARVTCDQRNIIYWRKNPQLMTAAERATVATVVTLQDTDWAESLPVRKRYDKQVSVVRAIAGVSNQTDVQTIAAVAPGASPGQEGGQEQLPNLLVLSQDDLNERLGRYYAWKNLAIPELPMTVFLQGMVNDPAWQEYAFFTLNADSNRRGLAIENQPYLLNSLDVTFNHEQGTSTEQWGLETLTAATGIASALTQQLPGAQPPDEGPYISSDGFFIDPLVTDPYTGPDWFTQSPPDYDYVAPFDYVPSDSSQANTGYVFAWTEDILYDSATGGISWADLFNPSADLVNVVYDSNSPFITDNTAPLRLWALTDNSLYYNDDVRGAGTWDAKQAISGGKLLRAPAGVVGGISVYVNDQSWTMTFDFTVSDWGFEPLIDAGGNETAVYTPGVGWEDTLSNIFGTRYRTCNIRKLLSGGATLTDITVNYTMTTGDIAATGDINSISAGGVILYSNLAIDPTPEPMTWSGTEDVGVGDYIATGLIAGIKNGSDPGGTVTMTSMIVTGTGDNPFGIGQILFSDDTGDTISTTEIEGSGDYANGCFDADDFDLGVFVVGTGNGIAYTETYTDANVTLLDGLTGLDGDALVTCVRIPFKKILTQADNDDASSLQFIYGTDRAVAGKTLWAVTFDATDGSIAAQVNITPVISGVTYYIIGAAALETAGLNTQVILALAKPVGGGSTRLIRTVNGAGSWSIVQTINLDTIHWVLGSATRAWLSGVAGVRYTTNRGGSLQNRSAGISDTPLGVYGFQ